MATPVWTTTAGKIATIDEQVAFSLQLEANLLRMSPVEKD